MTDRFVLRLALAMVNLLRWYLLRKIKEEDERPKPEPNNPEDILNPQDTM